MTGPIVGQMRRSRVEQRRASIERIDQVAAQDTWVMGRVMVEGAGESQVDVSFPVTFGEKPLPILGGGELDFGDSPMRRSFPTANAVVVDWDTEGPYYRGATLAITTTGPSVGQRLYVTFAFVGMALTNTGA